MKMSINIILLIISFIGLLILLKSCFNMMYFRGAVTSIGATLMIVPIGFILLNHEMVENTVVDQVAVMVDGKPENIVIEDMTEKQGLFSGIKNSNLRRAYYDGKSYVIELDGPKVNKLVEEGINNK